MKKNLIEFWLQTITDWPVEVSTLGSNKQQKFIDIIIEQIH